LHTFFIGSCKYSLSAVYKPAEAKNCNSVFSGLNNILQSSHVSLYVRYHHTGKPQQKARVMENERINQELLLNIHSSFCKRQWCEKNGTAQQQPASEQLKTICWDGMIPELLPEICLTENNRPLILWELMGTENMLLLKMGGFNEKLEAEFALHPYIVMDGNVLN
jgi:hypothetical protein